MSRKYEMHIYTMGTRSYAEAVVREIDPMGILFHDRILSRDENGSMTKKRLERLFPSDFSKVVVLDDRGDVWDYSENLIQIKPYEYFIGIGDINSPFAQPKKDIIPSAESLQSTKTITHKSFPAGIENGKDSPKADENITSKEDIKHQDNDKEDTTIKQNGHNSDNKIHQQESTVEQKENDSGAETSNQESDKEDSKDTDTNKQESDKEVTIKQHTDTSLEEEEDIYSDTEDDEENAPKTAPKEKDVFKVPARVQKPDTPLPNTHDTDDILKVIRRVKKKIMCCSVYTHLLFSIVFT